MKKVPFVISGISYDEKRGCYLKFYRMAMRIEKEMVRLL